MHYDVTGKGKPFQEIWQEKTVRVLSGGFNIVGFEKFAQIGYLPKGIPLNIDFANRNATPIKGAILNAAMLVDATTAEVKKGHTFIVGDFFGNSAAATTITAIDTTNANYDVFTLAGAIGVVSNGGLLLSATEAGAGKVLAANFLNYADVPYKAGVFSCTAVYAAIEVINAKLPYALSTTQKTELGSRFLVI